MPRVLVSVVAVPPSAMEDVRTALHLSTPPPSPAPEGGETVCAALARYEDTLRGTIREIHGDVSAFKLDVERRLEEAADAPLGRAVAQLQQENQQLRAQLDALAQQVELLSGMTYEHQGVSTCSDIYTNNSHHSNDTGNPSLNHHNRHHGDIGLDLHQEVTEAVHGKGQVQFPFQGSMCPRGPTSSLPPGSSSYPEPVCPPPGPRVTSKMTSAPGISDCPGTARFSSRATFALYSKANSVDHEEPIKVDPALKHSGPENGHTAHAVYLTHLSESPMLVHGQSSPPNNLPHEHTAAVSSRMLDLPMTAVTKVAEMRGPDSPRSPIGCQSSCVTEALLPASQSTESYCQPVSTAKAWTPASIRNLGFPRIPDKTNSAPAKSVTYSGLAPCEGEPSVGQVVEKRRELVRSQKQPRNIGAQARRSIFERLEAETNSHPQPPDNKPKLQRSQSFGVSSASSIKQILLDWCRSKTLGYQSVQLQNFSSSWSDGLAFCALVHSFFPSEFDYTSLSPAARKHNFELAFGTAEAKAGCDRLIEVEDMMIMGRKPDPMCVFTYVQSLYNHLRKFE
ncbi:smoothelin, like isoform X2 [Gadus morhua]|uniref:smoothelin, like isoform X2 n=1 Tax=Gadus morhua TaxID=8049 RepID=UPI0011B7292B|nr:smoothelin-like protein 2 isoform X2 [Gadus morhua]